MLADVVVAVVVVVVVVVVEVATAVEFVVVVAVAYVLQCFLLTEPQAKAADPRWKKLTLAAVE